MSEQPGTNQLLPSLLRLVAEVTVDYAISAKDTLRSLRYAFWEAGTRRGYSEEEIARLLDVSKSTTKNWKLERSAAVRSLWDATRALFDEQEEWTLQELHQRLRTDFVESRSSEWSYEVTEKLLSMLVDRGMLTCERGVYVRVPEPSQVRNRLARSAEEYRNWVDLKILSWVEIALTQRNATEEDVRAFEAKGVTTTRPIGSTSYSAHDFRMRAPEEGQAVEMRFEELFGELMRAIDKNTVPPHEPGVPMHVQVLYRILNESEELRH